MKMHQLLMNIKLKTFDMGRELHVKKYLPIKEKQMIAQLIINECTEEINGVIKLDSMKQYLSYVKYMIKFHTNLEYTEDDYDTLCSTEYMESNLLNAIMSCFGSDAEECSRILNLMLDDYMRDNSIECSVGRFLGGLSNAIDSLSTSFGDIDVNQMLKQYVK
jgi:hypothetical protein